MEISLLLMQQIAQLFLILIMGYAVVKAGLLKASDSRVLSVVMVYLVTPCVIINAFQIDDTPEIRKGLLYSMAIAAAIHVVLLVLSALLSRPLKLDAVEQVNVIYSNAAALVIPLVKALMGDARAVEGKIGRRVKRGPQLQPREQVQQELQPLGADRKLGAEIDSAAPFERKIELLDVETECHSHRRMAIRKKFLNSRNNTRGDIADMTMPSRSMVSTSSMRRRLSRAARTTNSVSNRKSEMRVRSITARARYFLSFKKEFTVSEESSK